MNSTKDKISKVLNYIIERKDDKARLELQKIIHEDERYVSYKELLKSYGFDFKTITIPEQTYTDLQNILKDFPKEVKLKVLDETWKLIKNEN